MPLTLKETIRQLHMLDQLTSHRGVGESVYVLLPDGRALASVVLEEDDNRNLDVRLVGVPIPTDL